MFTCGYENSAFQAKDYLSVFLRISVKINSFFSKFPSGRVAEFSANINKRSGTLAETSASRNGDKNTLAEVPANKNENSDSFAEVSASPNGNLDTFAEVSARAEDSLNANRSATPSRTPNIII